MEILYTSFLLLFIIVSLLFLLRVLLFKTGLIFITKKWWRSIEDCFHVYQFFKVPEFNESTQENQLYQKVSIYLSSLASMEDSDYTNLFTGKKSNDITLHLDPYQVIDDCFLGARVSWIKDDKSDTTSCRTLVLKVRRADKRRILRPYLQHIHITSDEVEQKKKGLRLYINIDSHEQNRRWRSVPFNHPSTFDTIVMDSDLKNKLISDLESFLKTKQYYQRLGRAWKRSYLLYGPPGTGKSSFVAAMANFIGYDVYDIDLSRVLDDSDLKTLLLRTTSKSVILIETLIGIFLTGASLSPAEIGELMLANRNSPSRALKSVITALQTDGDGRGSLNIRRQWTDDSSRKSTEDPGEHSGIFSREGVHAMKDFKKLYGLLRFKSSKISESFDTTPDRKEGQSYGS
ncbi:AAA-type ATPase family protein [Salix suchowensis]|nr:AAA-type ATPase family protein [Salix suchowensis]